MLCPSQFKQPALQACTIQPEICATFQHETVQHETLPNGVSGQEESRRRYTAAVAECLPLYTATIISPSPNIKNSLLMLLYTAFTLTLYIYSTTTTTQKNLSTPPLKKSFEYFSCFLKFIHLYLLFISIIINLLYIITLIIVNIFKIKKQGQV